MADQCTTKPVNSVRLNRSPQRRLPKNAISASPNAAAPIDQRFPNTPHRLLWSTGIIAFVLGIVAFVLWGINGAGILFDMIVALCS